MRIPDFRLCATNWLGVGKVPLVVAVIDGFVVTREERKGGALSL